MEQTITSFFSSYAYSPLWIYAGVVLFMFSSAFGMPIPEEVILVSSGFLGYMSLHPNLYPPPDVGASVVNPYILAAVALFAVIGADYLIFFIGQKFGPRILRTRLFKRLLSPERLQKSQNWVRKYGYFTVFIFRFTPGVRCPGHIMCGTMGLRWWKFLSVDAFAAIISVPTQVLLVAFYGEAILKYLKDFKIAILSILLLAVIFFAVRYVMRRFSATRANV